MKDFILLKYANNSLRKKDKDTLCIKSAENNRLFNELYFSRLISLNYFKTAFNFLDPRNIRDLSEADLNLLVNYYRGNVSKLNVVLKYLKGVNGLSSLKANLKTLVIFKEIKSIKSNLKKKRLAFPEKRFNARLKYKFDQLNTLTRKTMNGIKLGSSYYVSDLYLELIKSYDYLYQSIENFKPKGKSKDYIKSFKASMSKVSLPLKTEMKKLQKEARSILLEKMVFSKKGSNILTNLDYSVDATFDYRNFVFPAEKEF